MSDDLLIYFYLEDLIHETSTCFKFLLLPIGRPFWEAKMKIHHFKQKKQQKQKITVLTCYDYPSARIVADSKVDCVLVGDSVAMAVHGHESTISATMEMMELHTAAVARGLARQFLVVDLPFLCHRASLEDTVKNVKRLFQAGAHAVKIEGADESLFHTIRHLVTAGVPVMGHIGLTPQSLHQLGGYVVQGKEKEQAEFLMQQALQLEKAGCFAIVLECVSYEVAGAITESIKIPTIGIGAGAQTDGQVLVWHDMLGLQTEFKPKFVKQFVEGKEILLKAINLYADEVQQGQFPSFDHVFKSEDQ
jgi:3-methyl-2-oxobutanoate hydroxymethyltransferase